MKREFIMAQSQRLCAAAETWESRMAFYNRKSIVGKPDLKMQSFRSLGNVNHVIHK